MDKRKRKYIKTSDVIGVLSGEESDDWKPILSALARSCGLELRRVHAKEEGGCSGLIVLRPINSLVDNYPSMDIPTIQVIIAEATNTAADVCFSKKSKAPLPFRGRSVFTDCATAEESSSVSNGEILSMAHGKPIWTTISVDDVRHDSCWVPRPWIKKGECVFDHLNGRRFMNLLPVLDWLRAISDWRQWQQPPLRACFMFDDPNLHATRYGFVKYNQLAVEGRRQHYHSSFATVPLDSYYVNSAAARIIRDNNDTLSFLVHGNNHTYRELADRRALPAQHLAQMQQAAARIGKLEQKAKFSVSRVMAPPHGICSAEMMAAMTNAGFEAACISHGSVWTGNRGAEWTTSLGTLPATIIGGLPVIPRFGLDRRPENAVLLAAYLNQPIIPVGHHWDLADGTDILSSAAGFINSLGSVTWSDMTVIARSNYRFKVHGSLMHIHTFSRITTVDVPDGIYEIEVEAPWLDLERESVECQNSKSVAHLPLRSIESAGWRFKVIPRSRVNLMVLRKPNCDEHTALPPPTPALVIIRKAVVEMRDRCMPHFPRPWIRR